MAIQYRREQYEGGYKKAPSIYNKLAPSGAGDASKFVPTLSDKGPLLAAAQDAYNNAVSQAEYQKTTGLRQLGYDAEGNVSGHLPYGAYQQNRLQAGEATNQAQLSLAQRGIQGGAASQVMRRIRDQAGYGLAGVTQQAAGVAEGAAFAKRSAAVDLATTRANTVYQSAQDAQSQDLWSPFKPTAPSSGVKWGGQNFTSKAALSKFLKGHGVNFATWAANHPAAAKQLK